MRAWWTQPFQPVHWPGARDIQSPSDGHVARESDLRKGHFLYFNESRAWLESKGTEEEEEFLLFLICIRSP